MMLLLASVAFGADLEVSAKGKSVLIFLDGEKIGETPITVELTPGIHEITAKEDALSAAALNLKFAVFDQLEGRILFDWRKQQADLMWPGEERLKSRDRALLRNRELALAKQPGMFAVPAVDPTQAITSPEDLQFAQEIELMLDDEVLVVDEPEDELAAVGDAAEPEFDDLNDLDDLDDLDNLDDLGDLDDLDVLDDIVESPVDDLRVDDADEELGDDADEELGLEFLMDDNELPAASDGGTLQDDELVDASEELPPDDIDAFDLDSISFGEPDEDELVFEDVLLDGVGDEEEPELGLLRPTIQPVTEKPVRIREGRRGDFQPWIVGVGAAVVAGGFFGQAGFQWTMAKGYAERARMMEGSSSGVAEYEFNVDYARKKSGLTRASIGIGSAVLLSGVGVTIALGKR